MEQFNLEEYLKNPSRKVATRDGKRVRIVCTDKMGACPVLGLVKADEKEEILMYKDNGRIFATRTSEYDLFFAPERKEGWVNLYKNDIGHIYTGSVFDSKEEAESYLSRKDYLATVKIEWEE